MILAKRRAEQKRREAANRPPPSPPVPHLVPRHILQQTVEKLRREHELEVRALHDTIKELRVELAEAQAMAEPPSDNDDDGADETRAPAAPPPPAPSGPGSEDQEAEAQAMAEATSKDELVAQAKELSVAVRGSRLDIARRIVAKLAEPPAGDDG